MYIPTDAPHTDNAYKFIDFILRADVSADIVNVVNYANANGASWSGVDAAILEDPAIFPDEAVWSRIYAVAIVDPKEERIRTRAFARVKSGL
jgi:putrescine transport system substrate-binding protein